MNSIKTIFREIFGLFVDDASFALAILIWLCLVYGISSRHILSYDASAVTLFAGLALILVESAIRFARRKRSAAKR